MAVQRRAKAACLRRADRHISRLHLSFTLFCDAGEHRRHSAGDGRQRRAGVGRDLYHHHGRHRPVGWHGHDAVSRNDRAGHHDLRHAYPGRNCRRYPDGHNGRADQRPRHLAHAHPTLHFYTGHDDDRSRPGAGALDDRDRHGQTDLLQQYAGVPSVDDVVVP